MSISTVVSQQSALSTEGLSTESFIPQASQWVQLRDCLSPYGADQALLLCESGVDQWVAWVPNHGEALLGREQMVMAL
ncbi:MAG: hypothetical protein ACFCU8_11085 [Thermosynechococcaceae cyanobacterium]